jgi:nuclear cap-binding protein subunit 2
MFKSYLNVNALDRMLRYYTREDGENCMRYINGTRLDDRIVRTDWDVGFKEGRQYGRGKSGGQVKKHLSTLLLVFMNH